MHHSSINLQDPFCQLIPLRPLWTSPQWYPHLSSSPHSWWCPLELHPNPPKNMTIQMPHAFGTKIWYSLQKKRWSGIPCLFLRFVLMYGNSVTLTSPAGNLCPYIFSPSVLDVLFGQLDLAPRIFCLSDGHLHHDFLERSRDERINWVEGVPTLFVEAASCGFMEKQVPFTQSPRYWFATNMYVLAQ